MNPRTDSSKKPRSRKRWIVTWTVLLAAFVAAFLSPRKAKLRVQTDPNLALHWILVPESWRGTFSMLGKDRDHDSLPEVYLRAAEPVGTQWIVMLRQAEWRPDSFDELMLELAGSDGSEQQRWLDDSGGLGGLVVGLDASFHFHARALNGEEVCFTHEHCSGVAFNRASNYGFLLNGKPTTLIKGFQYVRTESGSDQFTTMQVLSLIHI